MIKRFFVLSGLCMFLSLSAQKTHTVIKGDTPYNISKKYGISVDELLKWNPNVKDGKLAIGDVVTVKSGTANAVATKTPASNISSKTGKIILQPKQTVYGITKQYRISETDLRKLNPELDSHMKIGDEITLPLDSIKKYGGNQPVATTVTKPVETVTETAPVNNNKTKIDSGNERTSIGNPHSNQDEYATYNVEQGDTVFSIVNKFGVTIDELIALNPELSKGLKAGMILKIRKLDAAYIKKNGDALSVVLMLPFGYSTNETQYRAMATDFLTGAKLAIERNASAGQKLDIKIVDSGNEASFKSSLSQINPNNTDLIIGPFFKSNVIDLLDFTKTQKIPVVAPFANSPELYNYSNLIIVETNDQTYADKIAEEVKSVYSNQKIYIVADAKKENANYLKSSLEKNVKNAQITIVNTAAEIQLDQNMMTGQSAPVIAILTSNNDSLGEAFSNKVIALSKEVQGIKAFSMYAVPSFDKKVDELSQASLVYLMDRKINADGNFEKEILSAYKSKYCKTPGKYAVIGFDVVNDMLTRENKKGEIFKQINKVQTQLATKFEFVKSKSNGAYVNTGFRVIRLVP
ncbi:LysM peptidoglycan-binding domain-containing protein [Chryseobacterium sp. Ch-15]|uniref:LysM peptidoglycan-binding domain-containing protein n=1 Tax=Chryseobacterium muglaense TaxID=2893752 RepID=A0A9Q3USN3_9FLAO|nr:LysM peptidoglycan-binding domain-containing protein [Chryseobacterium muglaense]MBD3903799.1 LysM peptidoglycan-binding domain-containing protein [Chryseobacterium muglaense]MCC9034873.1 LysM peptidoglycan-binding domain-containing protein [Chryseobacterium muglaense]MCM2553138.1 LysM peptidoglycan-binding domain-containing protein [Chryseobacterium muglaense]